MIDGTYIPTPETNDIIVNFLAALKWPDSIRVRKEISLLVTEAENKEGWRKMKEKTAGASGVIGFSHYKT